MAITEENQDQCASYLALNKKPKKNATSSALLKEGLKKMYKKNTNK